MGNLAFKFAEADGSGLSSLGLNFKAFLFQLIAFVTVLVILSKFVFPKIVKTLEDRRQVLSRGLANAQETQETLSTARLKAAKLVTNARVQADKTLADSRAQAKNIISAAEQAAEQQAVHIIDDAQKSLIAQQEKLRQELKRELAGLVTAASEKVIDQKLDKSSDLKLIEQAVSEQGK